MREDDVEKKHAGKGMFLKDNVAIRIQDIVRYLWDSRCLMWVNKTWARCRRQCRRMDMRIWWQEKGMRKMMQMNRHRVISECTKDEKCRSMGLGLWIWMWMGCGFARADLEELIQKNGC